MNPSAVSHIFAKNKFLQNVTKLSFGKLSALAIAVLATPVISRLFEPEHYGFAAVFIATITITASLLPLAYDRALLYPKSERKAGHLLILALTISALLTLGTYVIIGIFGIWSPTVASRSGMGQLFWLFPLGALLMAVRQVLAALCLRRDDYASIAKSDFAEAAVAASSRILWGLLLMSSATGLVFGHLLGIATAALICCIQSWIWIKDTMESKSISELREAASEFKDYPLFRAPARVSFSAARRLPVIALGILFSPEIVGFFAMGNRAVGRPLQAASKAVSDVLLRKTLGLRQIDQPLGGVLVKVTVVLALIGAPVLLAVFLFGEEILGWFLGTRWREAGKMVEILAPYLYVLWVGSFTSIVFETLRLNKLRLVTNIGSLLTRVATFVVCGALKFDIAETLSLYVVISCIYQILIYAIAARESIRHDRKLLRRRAGFAAKNDGDS